MRLNAGGGRHPLDKTPYQAAGQGAAAPTWTAESGIDYPVGDLRPIVDELSGRLYGLTTRGHVVLLREYEDYRKRCARDAAITFWGDPAGWAALPERVVACTCAGCDTPRSDLASAWRISGRQEGVITALAVSISDHGTELVGDEHVIYTSPHVVAGAGDRDIEVDTFVSMVERFGEPYDMSTGMVGAPYRLLYRTS